MLLNREKTENMLKLEYKIVPRCKKIQVKFILFDVLFNKSHLALLKYSYPQSFNQCLILLRLIVCRNIIYFSWMMAPIFSFFSSSLAGHMCVVLIVSYIIGSICTAQCILCCLHSTYICMYICSINKYATFAN